MCTIRQELTRTMNRYDILYDEVFDHDLLIEKTAKYLNATYRWDGTVPNKDDTGTPIVADFEPPVEDPSCFSVRNRKKAEVLETASKPKVAIAPSRQRKQCDRKRPAAVAAPMAKRQKPTRGKKPHSEVCI